MLVGNVVIVFPASGRNHSPWLAGKVRRHGWRSCGGGLSVGEENAGVDVVEGAEAEGEGDVEGDGDEAADDAELLVSSSEDDNPSGGIILTF